MRASVANLPDGVQHVCLMPHLSVRQGTFFRKFARYKVLSFSCPPAAD